MEVRRAVIPLDNSDRSAGFQDVFQARKRPFRLREVFQDKTDKDMVEDFRCKGEVENICFLENNVPVPGIFHSRFSFCQRGF